MSDDQYIWVRNWERFQHYRDRNPDWIKSYVEVLSSDEYLDLSLNRRGILHGLWLEFASSRRRLRLSTTSLTRRLNGRVTTRDIEALNRAGFIDIVASDALAACEQRYSRALASRAPARSREVEVLRTSTKRALESRSNERGSSAPTKTISGVCPECRVGGGLHSIECPALASDNGDIDW